MLCDSVHFLQTEIYSRKLVDKFMLQQELDMKSVSCEKDRSQRRALRDTTGNRITGVPAVFNRGERLFVNKVSSKSG